MAATITKSKTVGERMREIAGGDGASLKPIVLRSCTPEGRSKVIFFTVTGPPPGKPRMTRRDKWHKRPATERYWEWSNRIQSALAGKIPVADMVAACNWTAYFSPPASWPKKRREAAMGTIHRAKPDRDNVDKGVLDTLWKQDSGIGVGTIAKYWGEPARIEIEIVLTEGGSAGS